MSRKEGVVYFIITVNVIRFSFNFQTLKYLEVWFNLVKQVFILELDIRKAINDNVVII